MNDPAPLLQTERNAFTRRLLEEAQKERPSSELSARMLVGVSAVASLGTLTSTAKTAENSVPPPASLLASEATSAAIGSKILVGIVAGLAGVGLLAFLSLPETRDAQEGMPPSSTLTPQRSPETVALESDQERETLVDAPAPLAPETASDDVREVPASARAPGKKDHLHQELALLDAARHGLAQGEAKEALRLLKQYSQRFPQGKLKQEATVLRVKALEAQGNASEATRISEEFLRDNPDSAHKRRLGRELEK